MENIQETVEKLKRATKWFEETTGVESYVIGSLGITQEKVIELYEEDIEKSR